MNTCDQKMAEKAFACVEGRLRNGQLPKEYGSFAKSFPSLVHSCGFVQAFAFGSIKRGDYLKDIKDVLGTINDGWGQSVEELGERGRGSDVMEYMRLSRRALDAATWLKRYAQAYDDESEEQQGETEGQ